MVVAADGCTLDADELRAWCGEVLARHKVPRHVDVVDELPRNTVGKVLTDQVRALPLSRPGG